MTFKKNLSKICFIKLCFEMLLYLDMKLVVFFKADFNPKFQFSISFRRNLSHCLSMHVKIWSIPYYFCFAYQMYPHAPSLENERGAPVPDYIVAFPLPQKCSERGHVSPWPRICPKAVLCLVWDQDVVVPPKKMCQGLDLQNMCAINDLLWNWHVDDFSTNASVSFWRDFQSREYNQLRSLLDDHLCSTSSFLIYGRWFPYQW